MDQTPSFALLLADLQAALDQAGTCHVPSTMALQVLQLAGYSPPEIQARLDLTSADFQAATVALREAWQTVAAC